MLALVRRGVVKTGAQLRRERGQQKAVLAVEVAVLLVGHHERGGLLGHVAVQRRHQKAVALRDAGGHQVTTGEPVAGDRRHRPPAALQQLDLERREFGRRGGAGRGDAARGEVVAAAAEHGCRAHVQQVQGGVRDPVEHVLKLRALEAAVEVHRERLQALQAPGQTVAALGRDAQALDQQRLVHGQRGETAHGARQLDLVGGELARLLIEELDEGDDPVADAQRDGELRAVARADQQLPLGVAEARIVPRGDDRRTPGRDGLGAGPGGLQRNVAAAVVEGARGLVAEADHDVQAPRLLVDLVDVAALHAQGVEEPRDHRLEHLVHVQALGEVQTGVADHLQVAPLRAQLDHEAHVVHRHREVAGDALGGCHLIGGVVAAELGAVEHHHPDLPVEGAHGNDKHALQAQVVGERPQRGAVGRREDARQGGVTAQHLRGQRRRVVLPRDLAGIDAQAEPRAAGPGAAVEHQHGAARRVELLAEALQGVLEQLIEIVRRPAGEDVGAGLRQLRAQRGVVAHRRQAADEVGQGDEGDPGEHAVEQVEHVARAERVLQGEHEHGEQATDDAGGGHHPGAGREGQHGERDQVEPGHRDRVHTRVQNEDDADEDGGRHGDRERVPLQPRGAPHQTRVPALGRVVGAGALRDGHLITIQRCGNADERRAPCYYPACRRGQPLRRGSGGGPSPNAARAGRRAPPSGRCARPGRGGPRRRALGPRPGWPRPSRAPPRAAPRSAFRFPQGPVDRLLHVVAVVPGLATHQAEDGNERLVGRRLVLHGQRRGHEGEPARLTHSSSRALHSAAFA